MLLLRILGIILIVLGLVFCLTIIGAGIGIGMILIGAILVFVGRKPRPIIVQVMREERADRRLHRRLQWVEAGGR